LKNSRKTESDFLIGFLRKPCVFQVS